MHEKPRQDTSHDAESQSPMEVRPGDEADHIGFPNMTRRGMIETFRIANGAPDEVVQHRNGDIVQQQTADGFIDSAIVPQCPSNGEPDSAGDHADERHGGKDHHGRGSGHGQSRYRRDETPYHHCPFSPDDD